MGAWGDGVFENDAAGDWLDQLVESGKSTAIDEALSLAVEAKPERLEADEAGAALAAAEVVAAARGHRHAELPGEAKDWIANSAYFPTPPIGDLAVKAVKRVRDDSELAELWAEADEVAAWKRGIAALLYRLAKPAKPPKARKPAAANAKAPPKASPRNAMAALRQKRVFVVKQPGKAAPNWCCGIGSKSDKQPLDDADMEHFLQLPMLEDLSLSRYKITDAGIQHLAGMTQLTRLELKEMPITDACASTFDKLTGIASLDLSNTKVGDEVLRRIGGMMSLRELNLSHTSITDAGIKHLLARIKLTGILISGTRITDESFRTLAQIASIDRIIADKTAVTVRGVAMLKPLAKLSNLNLDNTALGDDACGVLSGYKDLESLSLSGTRITGAGLARLLSLKKLTWLTVCDTAISDADVPTLIQFPKGNIFALRTKISAKGKKQIAESGCTWISA
jgi:hypothetical protein